MVSARRAAVGLTYPGQTGYSSWTGRGPSIYGDPATSSYALKSYSPYTTRKDPTSTSSLVGHSHSGYPQMTDDWDNTTQVTRDTFSGHPDSNTLLPSEVEWRRYLTDQGNMSDIESSVADGEADQQDNGRSSTGPYQHHKTIPTATFNDIGTTTPPSSRNSIVYNTVPTATSSGVATTTPPSSINSIVYDTVPTASSGVATTTPPSSINSDIVSTAPPTSSVHGTKTWNGEPQPTKSCLRKVSRYKTDAPQLQGHIDTYNEDVLAWLAKENKTRLTRESETMGRGGRGNADMANEIFDKVYTTVPSYADTEKRRKLRYKEIKDPEFRHCLDNTNRWADQYRTSYWRKGGRGGERPTQ